MTVFVHGIEFYAYHGASDSEQKTGHRYVLDLEVECEEKACFSDKLGDTVDYAAMTALAIEVGSRGNQVLLEKVAQDIGDAILIKFKLAETVQISLAKMAPPMAHIAESAGVVLMVER